MRPIVDRLQADYDDVEFRYLNARDGADGQASFEQLGIPGHPGFVILDAAGVETFRALGVVAEADLITALDAVR